jgi:hypothetical protein
MEGKNEFQVSEEELEYLKQLALQDESIVGLLRFQEAARGRNAIVHLDRAQAEQLRSYLTGQLAAFGFDENYSPNERGQMLENLIDRFFLP